MASNGADIDLPKSTKNLFTLLSGSLNLKSHQFIATELERNTTQLTNGVLYYKSHNPSKDSLTELKKSQSIESLPVEVLSKTSLFLNLSSDQCKDLFHSYLIYEFKGTPEMVKTLFTNDIRIKQLLIELNQYYYSERLFSLFCMKQILSHWKQCSDHVYQQIFHSFLETINGNNELLPKLINQLVELNNSPVPSRLTNGSYFTETLAKEWFHNNLKEQIEVLQLLLIYLKSFETPNNTVIELLNLFRTNSFGLKFTFNRNDCDFIGEEVFKFIGFLESMIIVELLDLKWLYECQQQDIECQLFKRENAKQLKELDTIIIDLNAGVVEHSPIFMAWLIVRSWELPDFDSNASASVTSQLGSNAVQLNVFSYLEKCLHLPQTIALSGTMASDLIHQIISEMLFVTSSVFDIEMLGNSMTAINQLCIRLFQNDSISKDLFKNGLDSGLGLIISTGLTNFPFKVNPVLSFCLSLSRTEDCKQIFEKLTILSNLTSYTEPFDSSLTNYMPTEEESTYVLLRDKMLFRDTDLFIKKGTKGLLKIVSNTRVIEWTDINIDGWKLIYHRFKEQYDLISKGQIYSVPELALIEMSEITEICSNLIKHNCYQHISSFNRIIALAFETFELFASIEHPFRLFMASVLELSAAIVGLDLLDATTVWSRITGKHFMPYMIGLSSDLNEIMSGNDTNTSVFGQIITSEECLKGSYEMCISFLTLIEKMVQKPELKENSDLMASLIFIIQEVFPSHHFWNFRDRNQFHKIGRLCFDIFYAILSKTEKSSNKTKTEQIVINSLMEGKAAQTLLKVIKSGEMNVRNVILSAGNDNSLTNDDQIIIVRQSLSTLNRLLVLHTQTNSGEPTGIVATALFSSQSKPNMLLVVSHYVYQRYDTHLATLAVQLLTELAKRFPMSMLACLGSEAETMREHFLIRLDEVTEDLNLKIALLNFLSACAERQPGLMEMFLNVDNQNNENTSGCLQTVIEILEEKRDAKYFCPFELHLASLKFLYTFWVGPHLLAIDSLKKTSNVWTLITFPLFEESVFDDILCLYILRILAREIFYIKTLERDKFDSDLEEKFRTMRESGRLIQLSEHIRENLLSENTTEDSGLVLNAWKDFIVSVIKFDPFNITDDMKIKLSNDIIDSLLNQLKRSRVERKVITTLSDILLLILVNWKTTSIDSEEEWNTKIQELLKSTEDMKEILPFSVLHSIETLVIQFLQLSTKDFNSCDWIQYSCQLLNQSLRIIEKQIKSSQKSLEIEFKLSVTSLSLLQTLITRNSSRPNIWIQILRSNFIIESVTNLLNYLNEKNIALELAVHIMSLLIELSSIESSAESLFIIGFVDNLCISLQNTYTKSSVSSLKSKPLLNWNQVFHHSIRLIVNLVGHLRHHFVDTAITFVAIHLDHMTDVLKRLRTTPKIEEITESILIITLCHSLSRYHQIWRTSHPFSFDRIQEEILKTSNAMIAFLIRPNYLSYVMENPEPSKSVIPVELTPKKISPSVAFESKSFHKSISWEPESNIHSINPSILDSLFTFQAFSVAFLQNISPNVLLLMERQGLGSDWNIILNTSFSSPDVDPNMSLSFGALINCIHMCIKTLSRSEKASENGYSKLSPQISSLLIFIFEMSLSFMVSQAMVAQMSATVSDVDKQIIVREIKSELSTVISSVSPRQSKRLSQSSHLSTPRSPSTTSSLIERTFVKFLLQFVDKISQ